MVVSINRFASDTDAEIEAIREEAVAAGAREVVVFEGHAKGGEGAGALADAVVEACAAHDAAGRPYEPIVEPGFRRIKPYFESPLMSMEHTQWTFLQRPTKPSSYCESGVLIICQSVWQKLSIHLVTKQPN